MRIRVIHPVVQDVLSDDVLPPVPGFVELDSDWLPEGPPSIECRADEARAVPFVLDRVLAAAADGVDGVVLNCFMDPGLAAARELVRIPVAGPGQASMALAAMLGDTFSVILPATSGAPIVAEQATRYVGRERLASVRGVEMPVAELHDHSRLVAGLVHEAERAIDDDGAHVVILGCTGMSAVTRDVQEALAGRDVPVLDPTLSAIGATASQAIQGVCHSGAAYALPSWRTHEVRG
jgi:allantoin racemase